MKIVTLAAVGRLLGLSAGFIGFYLVAFICFPPENEIDSMMLVIPFLLGACATAMIAGWLGGRLFGRFGRTDLRWSRYESAATANKQQRAEKTQ